MSHKIKTAGKVSRIPEISECFKAGLDGALCVIGHCIGRLGNIVHKSFRVYLDRSGRTAQIVRKSCNEDAPFFF